jgi:G3E family GTPase
VFTSWGVETTRKYTKEELSKILAELEKEEEYGVILRAKGIVAGAEGEAWLHFDYVPEEPDVREGGAAVTGRLCVIGCKLNENALKTLFHV